jgi:glyoxylase-like metal-dependent hydrolase (beta-lactamase superfamily II)
MPIRPFPGVLLLCVLAASTMAPPALAQIDFDKIQIKSASLADGIYMLEGAGGNVGVSVGEDGVIVIDDKYAQLSDKILFAVREISDQPIRFVINTHWHGDHTSGNENFAKGGAWIVAHDNVRTRMSAEQFNRLFNRSTPPSPEGARPVVTFSDNMNFHLNGQDIHVFHVENAHTDGDAIVHFENRNVIHMGDCFWNGTYPLIDVGAGGSIRGMIRAANAALLLADGGTKIIPGHGAVGGREELRAFRDMLVEVEKRIQALVIAGQTPDQIAQAKPLADLDAQWAGGFMTPERFLQVVVDDLTP